jgi:predicted double-glycine peptidase
MYLYKCLTNNGKNPSGQLVRRGENNAVQLGDRALVQKSGRKTNLQDILKLSKEVQDNRDACSRAQYRQKPLHRYLS